MALGARRSAVLVLVLRRAGKLAVVGVVLGLGVSMMATRAIGTLLFGISPRDPMTYLVLSAILAVTALIATYLPARRATKVDPLVALRFE
jgi:putative ABC transport system permease protein